MNRHIPILMCGILPLVALYQLCGQINWQFILGYGSLISLITFVAYWQDKRRAQKQLWRVPEKSLHIFELLGGWPAAYLAQQVFRHKTSKRSFLIVYWSIVGIYQILALEWITNWRISRWLGSLI
ncbi:DUF1294 domain-containing protein [Coraliomargarita sp. SDUM461003]|uniref:DUF1294 domain-containing protein n=1 Tax=Thalassobacterium maritimum TaxID=3041265 RepID=A0ABU1AVT2_9BACT|nr:DUF1294 domain-containing protein [Coraliomargarita sp. SDUM461003]MDQ8207245.1 DUF1294 domain-containing protein [Coraliomargarita sp. SDUM461003]